MPCHPWARGTVTHRCSPHSILSFLHAESSSVKWLPLHREEGARKTGAASRGRCGCQTSRQTPSHGELTLRASVLISHDLCGPKIKNWDPHGLCRNRCRVLSQLCDPGRAVHPLRASLAHLDRGAGKACRVRQAGSGT